MADFASRRTTMVDTQVRPSDVTKFPIIDAMLRVPREDFVPDAARAVAYAEADVPLGEGRVVLAPRAFAKLLDMLHISPDHAVLDLGCGLGYSAAVLARMAGFVVAVEPDEALANEAQSLLSQHGHDNAAVVQGDLTAGDPQNCPYDVIVLQGGIQAWPEVLTEQLVEGGQVAAIWMDGHLGRARLGRKLNGKMAWLDMFNVDAPILPGFVRETAFAL